MVGGLDAPLTTEKESAKHLPAEVTLETAFRLATPLTTEDVIHDTWLGINV